MRLLEAIIDANHRALAGDTNAGLHPADYENELPMVALTCIDVRLNALLPQVLGVPAEQFIWLRNAGNIVTGPTSSTMRSLALACAVKGGKEIAVIGHTDCQVAKTGTMELLDRLRALGVERHMLPDNINEYFGVFSSERQNVLKAAELIRSSPIIGPKTPVHGLMVDIETGKLDWLVNGYEAPRTFQGEWSQVVKSAGDTVDALKSFANFNIGEMKFPETKIGEVVTKAQDWLAEKAGSLGSPGSTPAPPPPPGAPPIPPKIPLPPPIRQKFFVRRGGK
ncbi:MAG TPA: carbonic anhydrase [Verrucomicrobiae bacterium]|nr:carbonic anhydrase [Verrucomicrobiae bacterium]